ncbi:protoporphyrinogen/coproporphyrinogen oxidase [Microbacterium aurantiacum]|uniref:protoporphyrinogen/coproporphyrinogen oxidase n=1 Tax=Microbacterium aurantiacum TaxID=162393 RepID=UPI003448EA8C
MPDVHVVGGGVAGLVVARRLARGGADVVVHEASDRLGGTVASHEIAGIVLDAGAESFATRGGTVTALIDELGLAGDLVRPEPVSAWLQPARGDAAPLPATALLGIPGDPRAEDVVAIVGRAGAEEAVARDASRMTADDPLLAPGARLGPLVGARHGDAVLDLLVAPVVHGVHSLHPDDVPLERVHPRLRAALAETGSLSGAMSALRAAAPPGSVVAGLRGGVHRLVSALADDLAAHGGDIRLRSSVDVAALERLAAGGTVVVAAPDVLPTSAPPRRIDLVTLVVDQPELDAAPRGSGLLVAAGAPVGARALTHATAKWAWLADAAGGRHVLRLSYDDLPEDPVASARADAAALLGVALPVPEGTAHVTWFRPAAAIAPAGITVVGETAAGSGLAGIITHAEAAASALATK